MAEGVYSPALLLLEFVLLCSRRRRAEVGLDIKRPMTRIEREKQKRYWRDKKRESRRHFTDKERKEKKKQAQNTDTVDGICSMIQTIVDNATPKRTEKENQAQKDDQVEGSTYIEVFPSEQDDKHEDDELKEQPDAAEMGDEMGEENRTEHTYTEVFPSAQDDKHEDDGTSKEDCDQPATNGELKEQSDADEMGEENSTEHTYTEVFPSAQDDKGEDDGASKSVDDVVRCEGKIVDSVKDFVSQFKNGDVNIHDRHQKDAIRTVLLVNDIKPVEIPKTKTLIGTQKY